MEDKRKLANEQLQETLDSGILSFAAPQEQNFVELPESSESDSATETANVTNNFNVNVNVNGTGNSRSIQQTANSAIQNALPNLYDSSEDLKKNSSANYMGNFEEGSELISFADSLADMGGGFSPELIYTSLSEFQTPDVSHYTYSESTLRENNSKINNQYEVLKNVIYSSTENQNITNISPYTSTDPSFYIDQSSVNDQTINNLSIENQMGDTTELITELSRKQDNSQKQNMVELNKTLRNVQDISNLNEREIDDVAEATTIGRKRGSGVPGESPFNPSMVARFPENISTSVGLNTVPKLIEKMNRPPTWRSVLG